MSSTISCLLGLLTSSLGLSLRCLACSGAVGCLLLGTAVLRLTLRLLSCSRTVGSLLLVAIVLVTAVWCCLLSGLLSGLLSVLLSGLLSCLLTLLWNLLSCGTLSSLLGSLNTCSSLGCLPVGRGDAGGLLRRLSVVRSSASIAGGSTTSCSGILDLAISSSLGKSLTGGKCSGGATCWCTRLSGASPLDTTSNASLVADSGTDCLGGRSSRGHVGINIGKDVNAAVLVDQVDVTSGSHSLNRHLLKFVDDILEGTASGERTVGSNDIGVRAVSSVNDGLVVELIDLGVKGHGSSLLELNVVLDASSSVEEVGNHRGIGHPIGDRSGEVVRSGSLSVLDTSAKSSWGIGGALLLLVSGLRSLLLLLLIAALVRSLLTGRGGSSIAVTTVAALNLGEWGSVSRRGKERGNENVLHFVCENGSVEWTKIMSKDIKE